MSNYIKNFFLHLKKIIIHKYWVGKYCFKLGLYKQGIFHDMSKFSPTEFFESVKWYQGDRSPIDACKKDHGYSMSWFHHRGRNKHHYEYWTDNYDSGTTCCLMPYKYAAEMICDYIGAARAYLGDKFSYASEYEWWLKKSEHAKMHSAIKKFVTRVFHSMKEAEEIGGTKFADWCFSTSRISIYYTSSVYVDLEGFDIQRLLGVDRLDKSKLVKTVE